MSSAEGLIIACLVAVAVVFLSYRSIRRKAAADPAFAAVVESSPLLKIYLATIAWSTRVVPPLALVGLYGAPLEPFLMFYWLIGMAACLISVFNLARMWALKRPQSQSQRVIFSVRPALTPPSSLTSSMRVAASSNTRVLASSSSS